ncbi:hypothetical protein TNCV_672891 [Trichonephila clavipes]|nr:hypothetical protein TNCV_672891 [Trichonephila clavipes]
MIISIERIGRTISDVSVSSLEGIGESEIVEHISCMSESHVDINRSNGKWTMFILEIDLKGALGVDFPPRCQYGCSCRRKEFQGWQMPRKNK